MTFDLPIPPSLNSMFATDWKTKRRFKSKEYAAWQRKAGDALGAQYARYGSPSVHGPVSLTIRVNISHAGDISNRIKAVEDLLVANLDMPDDRYIDDIRVIRDRTIEGAVVTIGGADDGFRSFGEIASGVVDRLSQQFNQDEAA